MKLSCISITNYRTITRSQNFNLSDHLVLIGGNTSLKSTLLYAIKTALELIKDESNSQKNYIWEKDFPGQLMNRKTSLETTFKLKFCLDENDSKQLKTITNMSFKDELTIEIVIGCTNISSFNLIKDEKTSVALNGKLAKIREYITQILPCVYISSYDTNSLNMEIEKLLTCIMTKLQNSSEYIEAINTIKKFNLNKLAELSNELISGAYALNDLKLDYSYITPKMLIEANGMKLDSVYQNDVKIGMILKLIEKLENAIILMDEPEVHLSQEAIYLLSRKINGLKDKQFIVSTQNSNLVDLENISNNVIVEDKPIQAKKLLEIQNSLGIDITDEFSNYQNVIFVQNANDLQVLELYIRNNFQFTKLGDAIKAKKIGIIDVGENSKILPYILKAKKLLVKPYIILNNTEASRKKASALLKQEYVSDDEIVYTMCNGEADAEMIDSISPMVYTKMVLDKYEINLKTIKIKNVEFSKRIEEAYTQNGKKLSRSILNDIKASIVSSAAEVTNIEVFPDQRANWLYELLHKIDQAL